MRVKWRLYRPTFDYLKRPCRNLFISDTFFKSFWHRRMNALASYRYGLGLVYQLKRLSEEPPKETDFLTITLFFFFRVYTENTVSPTKIWNVFRWEIYVTGNRFFKALLGERECLPLETMLMGRNIYQKPSEIFKWERCSNTSFSIIFNFESHLTLILTFYLTFLCFLLFFLNKYISLKIKV